VSFNAAETAYAANNPKLFRLAVNRLRAGYRPAFQAWLALGAQVVDGYETPRFVSSTARPGAYSARNLRERHET
jgi:hypothetical protein